MVDPSSGMAASPEPPAARRPDAFGNYLRKARTERRLSQSELAHRIGLSAGMVSQLEKGLTLPSVSTMLAVANELGVTLDSLFGAAEADASTPNGDRQTLHSQASASQHAASPAIPLDLYSRIVTAGNDTSSEGIEAAVQRRETRAVLTLEDGVTWELLTKDPNHHVLFVIATYPVGAATTTNPRMVRHPDVEYLLMLEGELDVSLEFSRTTVRAGDAMWFDSMKPHNFENRGDSSASGVFLLIPQGYRA